MFDLVILKNLEIAILWVEGSNLVKKQWKDINRRGESESNTVTISWKQ